MKNNLLLFMTLLSLTILSCKKSETEKSIGVYNVSLVFNPDGNESDFTLTDQQTGEIETYLKQTSKKVISKQVLIGDKFLIEMKGRANGSDDKYNIQIIYKDVVIATDRAFGGAIVKDQALQIDKIFKNSDFDNK